MSSLRRPEPSAPVVVLVLRGKGNSWWSSALRSHRSDQNGDLHPAVVPELCRDLVYPVKVLVCMYLGLTSSSVDVVVKRHETVPRYHEKGYRKRVREL